MVIMFVSSQWWWQGKKINKSTSERKRGREWMKRRREKKYRKSAYIYSYCKNDDNNIEKRFHHMIRNLKAVQGNGNSYAWNVCFFFLLHSVIILADIFFFFCCSFFFILLSVGFCENSHSPRHHLQYVCGQKAQRKKKKVYCCKTVFPD